MIDWIAPGVTFILGVGATWLIARREMHRPKLIYTLRPAAVLHTKEVGSALSMTLGGKKVDNLCVFTLEIFLKGRADVAKVQVVEDNKPTLFFPKFRAFNVRTIEYDETRFRIPLGLAGNGSLIVINLERIRANTKAEFQIIGTLRDDAPPVNEYWARFYPGTIHNVDTETAGAIERPWQKGKVQ